MDGDSLVTALKKRLDVVSDRDLATHLGITVGGLQLWKKRDEVTVRQLASLVGAAYAAGQKDALAGAIRPLVEFYRLDKCAGAPGKFEIFSRNAAHPYLDGLARELDSHHGVYVFFDSRGHAIYAGKARRQMLWKEMNLAFNRDRNDVQSVKRVNHPSRRQAYKTGEEKSRQIVRKSVALHEMAVYCSAYQVVDEMVDEVEAMLVRSFANDLLNVRMERFGSQRRRLG